MIVIWLLIGVAIIVVVCIAIFARAPASNPDLNRDLNLNLELDNERTERNKYNNEIFIYNPSISLVNGSREKMYTTRRLSPDNIIIRNYIKASADKEMTDVSNEQLRGETKTEMIEIEKPNGDKIYKILDKSKIDNSLVPCGYEDARIFNWKGEKWVITYKRDSEVFKGFRHKIVFFSINNPEKEIYLDYHRRQTIEKNWMPFEWNGKLMILYSFNPYIVLEVDDNGKCTELIKEKKRSSNIKLGVGLGSPPILINNKYFLCMAHIRDMKQMPVRKNFFFTINFSDLKIMENTPVINFTKEPIEFGAGLDLLNNGNILISLGINDHFSVFGELPLNFILGLIPKQLDMNDLYRAPSFIINMERSSDRLSKAVPRIKDAGFTNISRFKAVDGSIDNLPKIIDKLNLVKSVDEEFIGSAGKQGCVLSHISLWQKIVDEKIPRANIFEDDIIFPEKWRKAPEYIKKTSFDTDIIFTGNQVGSNLDKMVVAEPTFCTHAYTITYAGADKLLKMVRSEPLFTIDCMLIEEMKRFAPCFSWVCWVGEKDEITNKRSVRNTGLVYQDEEFISLISND